MSDLYNRIISQRGRLEEVIARIPGFRGYKDKQARREADQQLREYLSQQLDQRIQRFVRIEKAILDKMGMSPLSRTRDVKGQLQLYRDRVSAAAPGYSGLWAEIKIGEDELEMLYTFDEAQIRYIDKIDVALEKLNNAVREQDGVDDAIMDLDGVVREANDAFSLRDDVINGFSRSL